MPRLERVSQTDVDEGGDCLPQLQIRVMQTIGSIALDRDRQSPRGAKYSCNAWSCCKRQRWLWCDRGQRGRRKRAAEKRCNLFILVLRPQGLQPAASDITAYLALLLQPITLTQVAHRPSPFPLPSYHQPPPPLLRHLPPLRECA